MIFLVLLLSASTVFAALLSYGDPDREITGLWPGDEDITQGLDGNDVPLGPVTSGEVYGYWVAAVVEKDSTGITPYYFPADLGKPKKVNPEDGSSTVLKGGRFPGAGGDDRKSTSTLSDPTVGIAGPIYYDNMYEKFQLVEKVDGKDVYRGEIVGLKYVLDLSLFEDAVYIGGDPNSIEYENFPSHGGNPDKQAYEGGMPSNWKALGATDCQQCATGDRLYSCTDGQQYSCIYVPILKRRDCSMMSDYSQPFCEGISRTGPNADRFTDPNTEQAVVELTGVPGYGGCSHPDYYDDAAERTGKDWYRGDLSALSNSFKPAFGAGDEGIGLCCGNDPEDIGALAAINGDFPSGAEVPDQTPGNKQNNMMCMPVASYRGILPTGDLDRDHSLGVNYVWNSAVIDRFNIRKINRSGLAFDAVANYDNWFVCDSFANISGEEMRLGDFYEPYAPVPSTQTPDPLLSEFDILPSVPYEFGYGVTGGIGGAGADGGTLFGLGTTPGAQSVNSETDVVDQDSFDDDLSTHGPAFATPCDQDGDGYDGAYTTDILHKDLAQGAVNFEFFNAGDYEKFNPECPDPQPPFDCDEMDASVNPGADEYCGADDPGKDYNCNGVPNSEDFCIPSDAEDPCSPGGDASQCNITAQEYAPRFICYGQNLDKDTIKGSFAECCGFSLSFCKNPYPDGRREGGAIKTLREFQVYDNKPCGSNESNCVLKYGISRVTVPEHAKNHIPYSIAFMSDLNDMPVRDWHSYEYVDFYVYFAANFIQRIKFGKYLPPNSPYLHESYAYYFDEPIVNYVVNEPQLGKWLHVRIPISEFKAPPYDVDIIVLYADSADIKSAGTEVRSPNLGAQIFSNVIGLDKIHLVSKEGNEIVNRWCTGTFPISTWISDLDEGGEVAPESLGSDEAIFQAKIDQPGRAACAAVPSYGWTGHYCCGDDTGDDTEFDPDNPQDRTIGDDTEKEFFNDTDAGCWGGNKIADGQRVMMVEYELTHTGSLGEDYDKKLFSKSCRSVNNCTFNIPQVPGLVIENPHPEDYNLIIASGTGQTRTKVGAGTVLNNKTAPQAILKAESVPLQIQYYDGSFHTCNPSPYLDTLDNTNTKTIPNDLLSDEEPYGSCQVLGSYFCDHVNGSNAGWSANSLQKYPLSTNITIAEGETIELALTVPGQEPIPTSRVEPTYRTYSKHTYNLIRNGGFERR